MNEYNRGFWACLWFFGSALLTIMICLVNALFIERGLSWFTERISPLDSRLLGPVFFTFGFGDAPSTELWAALITIFSTVVVGIVIHMFFSIRELGHQIRTAQIYVRQSQPGQRERLEQVITKCRQERGQLFWWLFFLVPPVIFTLLFDGALLFLQVAMRIYEEEIDGVAQLPSIMNLLTDQWGTMASTILVLGMLAYVGISVGVAAMLARSLILLSDWWKTPGLLQRSPQAAVGRTAGETVRRENGSAVETRTASPVPQSIVSPVNSAAAGPSSAQTVVTEPEATCPCGKRFEVRFYRVYGHPGCPKDNNKGE